MAQWKRILTEGDVGPGTATDTSLGTHDQTLTGSRVINAANSSTLFIKGDDGPGDVQSPFIARFSATAGDSSSTTELFGQVGIRTFQSGGAHFDQGYIKFYENDTNGEDGVSVYAPADSNNGFAQTFALPLSPETSQGHFLTLEDSAGTPYAKKWVWKNTPSLPVVEGGAGEQGGVVVGQADAGSFLMVVHDVAENKLKKLDIQELYAAITVELFQALIDAGYGSQEAYTGTGGQIADLNNDGSVSTADLLEFLTAFGGIESADPTTVILTSTPQTADSNGFQSPVKLDIGTGDAAVNSGDFTTIINVELDHFTISEGLNNSLTQYPNKSIVIKPAVGFETGAITLGTATPVTVTAKLYIRVKAFKPDGQPLNGNDGELFLLESITTQGIPGFYSYPISEHQISGDVLGINDSANGDPCASLKISYEIQDVSGGFLSSAKIDGIEFQLTTNI
ncbi:MAG: hypothetical protein CMI60_07920 [Parvibaculum sp.]|nr:hypothetical protein [Parvibaculum sp.]